jgi:hypothetical protein
MTERAAGEEGGDMARAMSARSGVAVQRARTAAAGLIDEAWTELDEETIAGIAGADAMLATLLAHADPIAFVRAARDELTKWLEDAARQVGGPTENVPAGWPWDTWPT